MPEITNKNLDDVAETLFMPLYIRAPRLAHTQWIRHIPYGEAMS